MIQTIRNAVRVAVAGFCLLSLLTCIGTAWLWRRSYRAEDRAVRTVRGVRLTARSHGGRLALLAPPPPAADAAARRTVSDLVGRMRNDDIGWAAVAYDEFDGDGNGDGPGRTAYLVSTGTVFCRPDAPAGALDRGYVAADRDRPLLDALDDPGRFAAAHVLLTRRTPAVTGRSAQWGWAPDYDTSRPIYRGRYEGLAAELRAAPDGDIYGGAAHTVWVSCAARYDPAQIPALCDNWHRRLDVPVASARHWQVVAVAAAPPGLWLAARCRRACGRRRRARRGLCRRCGYDLRGNESGRCPECGAGREP